MVYSYSVDSLHGCLAHLHGYIASTWQAFNKNAVAFFALILLYSPLNTLKILARNKGMLSSPLTMQRFISNVILFPEVIDRLAGYILFPEVIDRLAGYLFV